MLKYKRISCSRGVSLVEAAVVMPVMVLAMILVAQIGIVVNTKLVVVEAAREAAREYATFHQDSQRLCAVGAERAYLRAYDVIAQLPGAGLTRERIRITPTQTQVAVEIAHPAPVFVPGMNRLVVPGSAVIPGTFTLTAQAIFRMEAAP